MYTAVRHYRCEPEDIPEMAHRADQELADMLAQQDGFVAYELIDCGDGALMSITVFTDEEGAERSSDLAAEFVRTSLSGFEIERTGAQTGEVLVNRARQDVLELVHA